MDRRFTGAFFRWPQAAWQTEQRQKASLQEAFPIFAQIAKETQPTQYVGGGWQTSRTKVIDNAIVAYCRRHCLDDASRERAILKLARGLGLLD